jgi:hypothetical protein
VTDDDALARLVRAAAPDVLADALARAREQAVARLTERLTDALVAEALQAGAPTAPAAPAAPEPTVTPEPPPVALYAYAITCADAPLPAAAPLAGGDALAQVVDADLALLVSSVDPARLRVDQDDLSEDGPLATLVRGHDAVLTAAAAAGPVLPLRFGTLVPDESAAHRLLGRHAATARAQLERIGGAREWGVRLVRTLADPGPAPTGTEVSGTEYLSRRRKAMTDADRAGAVADRAAQRLEAVLAPLTRACLRRGGSPGSSLLLDLACLVEPDREADVTAALEQLAAEESAHGLALEATGPWPPYSFADLPEEAPRGA